MKTAIIGGYGKMGRWIAGSLQREGHDVVMYGRNREKLEIAAHENNAVCETELKKAVDSAGLIIVSVSIDSFEAVIRQMAPFLNDGQKVIDITSVKVMPVEIMHRYLKKVTVLGAHPVFGPGAKSVRNQNVILTPTDDDERKFAGAAAGYLEERGALVTIMTPREHDNLMSVVLGLSHFIAITAADVLLRFEGLPMMKAVGGPTYKALLTLAESVITEDPHLYASIQMNLPDMAEKEELFRASVTAWADIVRNGDRQRFIDTMNALKVKVSGVDPDFGRSYQDIYTMLEAERKTSRENNHD